MNHFAPNSLPSITSVQIVVLDGINPSRVSEYMQVADAPSIIVIDQAAQHIADLWRRLLPGETSRCHTPPFGLRFLADGEVKCQASICWKCDNIFGDVQGISFSYAFDAEHDDALELLAELKRLTI